jgi:hypothetical protein
MEGGGRRWIWSTNATSRQVAGSFPDEVIGFFNWPNLSSRTMALGSTQPLTEMSTSNLPRGEGRVARKADNLSAISEPIVLTMWEPRRLTTLRASTACSSYPGISPWGTEEIHEEAVRIPGAPCNSRTEIRNITDWAHFLGHKCQPFGILQFSRYRPLFSIGLHV